MYVCGCKSKYIRRKTFDDDDDDETYCLFSFDFQYNKYNKILVKEK